MPRLPFQFAFLEQLLEGEYKHLEPLLFPELSRVCRDSDSARLSLRDNIQRLIKSVDPATLHARRIPEDLILDEILVTLRPPQADAAWRNDVELAVQYVSWSFGPENSSVAYVPALDIDVIVRAAKDVKRQVEFEVRAALVRERMFSLAALSRLAQVQGVALIRDESEMDALSASNWAAKQEHMAEPENESALREVATDLRREPLPPAYELEATIRTMARLLKSAKNPHVVLIGPSGVGKTAAFYELVRSRNTLGLRGREFWETSGARLVAGMSGFGMWQERCQRLLKETAERDVVLLLGNLVELMEVGQSTHNDQSIASFLRNALYRGELTAVAECTEAQLSVIERRDPQLLAAFQPLRMSPPSSTQLQSILLSAAVEPAPIAANKKRRSKRKQNAEARRQKNQVRSISPESLVLIEQLHARFATYSAAPGRPLRFLRNLVFSEPFDEAVEPHEVIRSFAKETGLPLFLLDDAAPMLIDEARSWFSQRLIGQPLPVDVVVDLLATIKAGLSRPDRPLASLLFIGPTGVGKTELAKSIAAFLYHNERRLVRFDMSEFADPISVDRLIGGSFATEGLLTRRIREQPFTVVLFDEVEKADAGFFDLLLQIMGEGRLTDSSGRVADFRNSVIVMTSNLGAESFRGSRMGIGDGAGQRIDAEAFFVRRVREFMRPELYNRLDRVVPFQPLAGKDIQQIAKRELAKLQQRDGLKYRNLSMEISPAVFSQIALDGAEATLGARPLKRIIERTITAPLASRLNNHSADHSFQVKIDHQGTEYSLQAKAEPTRASRLTATLQDALESLSNARRRVQRLTNGATALRLRNEMYRLEQRQNKIRRRAAKDVSNPYAFLSVEDVKRTQDLKHILTGIEKLESDANEREEQSLLSFYREDALSPSQIDQFAESFAKRLDEWLVSIHRFESPRASSLTLSIFSESKVRMQQLCNAYQFYAKRRQWSSTRYFYRSWRPALDADSPQYNEKLAKATKLPVLRLLARTESDEAHGEDGEAKALRAKVIDVYRAGADEAPAQDVIGIGLFVRGDAAFSILEGEMGQHEFGERGRHDHCVVETSPGGVISYAPPEDVLRRSFLQRAERRRRYDLAQQTIQDYELKSTIKPPSPELSETLAAVIDANLAAQLEQLLDE